MSEINRRPKTAAQISRKSNLLGLIGSEHGDVAKFASANKMSAAYLWQIKNTERGVGETVARKVEASLGLEQGWLDQDHSKTRQGPDLFSAQLAEEAKGRNVPDEMQKTILYLLKNAPKK